MIEWMQSLLRFDSRKPFEFQALLLPSLHHPRMKKPQNKQTHVNVHLKRKPSVPSGDFADRTFQSKKPSFRMSKTTLFLFTLMQTIRLLWITLAIALFSCANAKRLTADECKGMALSSVVTP